jgi:hypothetical protein
MDNRDDDQDWLDALAGKATTNANQSTIAKASALRNAIQKHNELLLGESYNVDSEIEKLKNRLVNEGLSTNSAPDNSIKKRWAAFIAGILSAFAFGAMVMRFVMMPTMEGVRSNGETTSASTGAYTQTVAVLVKSPFETMQVVVAEASRIEMSFSVKVVEGGYDLTLVGLVTQSPSQENIRNVLGLSKMAAGDIQFQIRKKE